MGVLKLYHRSGVYFIRNKKTGKRYVGSSATSVKNRVSSHIQMLRSNTHCNNYLQNSWNKHGEDSFEAGTLSLCPPERCVPTEQRWIDRLKAADSRFGYNLSPTAGSRLGVKVSEESRIRISRAQMGKKLSEEHKAKVSAGNMGKKASEEAKQKISRGLRGNKNGVGKRPPRPLEVRMKRVKDLTGKRYGRLVALKFYDTKPHARWTCRCDCGKEVVVFGNGLSRGSIRSCGCLLTDTLIARNKGNIGKHHSASHRMKIGAALIGNRNAQSG